MSRLRLITLSLVAAFALSAVAASAASALEQYEFLNKEGKTPTGEKFSASSLKAPRLNAGNVKLVCTSNSSKGEISGKSTVKGVVVTYIGCEEEAKKCKVNSEGAAAGTIVTKALKGTLGEEATADVVAEDLEPEVGTVFTKFKAIAGCIIATSVTGSVLGEVPAANVNKLSKTGKLVFEEAGGLQKLKNIELEGSEGTKDEKDTLLAFGEPARYVGEEEITYTNEVEVKTSA